MRIAVTGATGFLGRYIVQKLLAEGHTCRCWWRKKIGAHAPDPHPAIEWIEGDAVAPPYDDGSSDLVLCQQGLQFFPNREQSAREIFRVLKPGGRLVANVWQGTDVHPVFEAIFS